MFLIQGCRCSPALSLKCGARSVLPHVRAELKALAVTDTAVLSGAGIAARRIHQAVRLVGIDSHLAVARAAADIPDAIPLFSRPRMFLHSIRRAAAKTLLRASGADASKTLSPNLLPSKLGAQLARFDAELIHLHWI